VLAGAAVGLLCRLLLALPADLYSRVLAAAPDPRLPPGSFASWVAPPLPGEGFIRQFVLATWWVGALAGAALVWRRASRKRDVGFGLVAGGVAGLAGAATLACLIPVMDTLPRWLWYGLGTLLGGTAAAGGALVWTPVWIALAASSWGLLGGAAGVLCSYAGRPGAFVLTRTAQALAVVLRGCGLERAAHFFAAG
jgi:hypothetical protein